jgi:LPXTG-site transpeptidase (sortase) family protein
MSKIFTKTTLIIALSIAGALLYNFSFAALANAPVVNVVEPQISNLKGKLKGLVDMQYAKPTTVIIESIGVNASVESVGIEQGGAMEVPANFSNIGWLDTSSKLGQGGNLVLSGHYDTTSSSPAVFYNLANVQQNNIVKVSSTLPSGVQSIKSYKVTKVYLADPNNVDHVKEAYRQTKTPTITLITCNGIWDAVKGEYSHRVVVKGELVN